MPGIPAENEWIAAFCSQFISLFPSVQLFAIDTPLGSRVVVSCLYLMPMTVQMPRMLFVCEDLSIIASNALNVLSVLMRKPQT